MRKFLLSLAAIAAMALSSQFGCTDAGSGESTDSLTSSRSEHDRDGQQGEGHEHDGDGHGHHGKEREESGTEMALDQIFVQVRKGARLILAYDAESNTFLGTVENTTGETLRRVRVEVHLSNGKELGPTTAADLEPGQKMDVKLQAEGRDFDAWNAHPEVGGGEHGHGEGRSENEGEHD